jgi:enoyl-CoA hydratase/carnithine racemase
VADEVLYESDDGIAVITLNRPDKRNALNAAVREGLWSAWRRFESEPDQRVAILTGAGPAFCAGIDLVEFADTRLGAPPPNFLPVLGENITVTKPTIAVVNGSAVAGGWRLVQMCDLCVASETARFAITEARVGRGMPWAAPLVHMLPPRILLELLMTGEPISAQRAYEIGFVNHVVSPADVMARARALARSIIAGAPLVVKAARDMVAAVAGLPAHDAVKRAEQIFAPVYDSQDAIEGPLAFREKRPPRWSGR